MKSQLAVEATVLGRQAKTHSNTRFLPWLLSVAAVVGLLLLIVGIHRNSPRTLISFHGYLHAAIAERFLTSNSPIPPENPFYAGQPLPYYWFFHFVGAQVCRLTGWNIFFSLEAVVLAGAGLLGLACLLLGHRLYGRVVTGLLMAYLVLAGTNPFGIVLAGLKVLAQGTGRLKDDPNFLWNVVHPVYNLVRFNDIGALYGPLISFFLNMTSRPLALGSLMMALLCLQWALRAPRLLPLAALGASFALTTPPARSSASGRAECWAGSCFCSPSRRSGFEPARRRHPRYPTLYSAAFAAIIGGVAIALADLSSPVDTDRATAIRTYTCFQLKD